MPPVTTLLILWVFLAGTIAGALGAVLGIGGGVFLMPFLTLVLHMPFTAAAAISLTTVIATSTAVAASTAGQQLMNIRLGMLLEVATAAGGLAGGLISDLVPHSLQFILFGLVMAVSALMMLGRLDRRNVILDSSADPGRLGGRFYEAESGGEVVYRVKRIPLALAASLVAGVSSTLLGIGGGTIKVPVLNAWCGVPMRAAAATSAFMIGVTAVSGDLIYYGRGQIVPSVAAAAVLGVRLGSWAGLHFGARASARWIKLLMAVVLFLVAASMLARGL